MNLKKGLKPEIVKEKEKTVVWAAFYTVGPTHAGVVWSKEAHRARLTGPFNDSEPAPSVGGLLSSAIGAYRGNCSVWTASLARLLRGRGIPAMGGCWSAGPKTLATVVASPLLELQPLNCACVQETPRQREGEFVCWGRRGERPAAVVRAPLKNRRCSPSRVERLRGLVVVGELGGSGNLLAEVVRVWRTYTDVPRHFLDPLTGNTPHPRAPLI